MADRHYAARFFDRERRCQHCGGASGHPPISHASTVESPVMIRGLRAGLRQTEVCLPCLYRIVRSLVAEWDAEDSAVARTVQRRLSAIRGGDDGYAEHVNHIRADVHKADCFYCAWRAA